MKHNFKVLSVVVASLFIGSTAMAQSKLGIRAGVNFSNLTGKSEGEKIEGYKLTPGINIGVTYDVNLADEFYVQPALLYSGKGASADMGGPEKAKISLSYLEVPINFLYKPELGSGHLLLGVGPYLGYGLNGKVKVGSESETLKFGKDETFKAMDYGGNLLFGYQLSNGISAQLNAQYGMNNIMNEGDKNNKINHTQFGISLGYKF